MISRKEFIKKSLFAAAGSTLPTVWDTGEDTRSDSPALTILYTNDTHSRVEPFPKNSRLYPGLGGAARRTSLVKKIRHESKNTLLLDAGDVFQGTAWFDLYGGELNFKIMSQMGYDAMVLGNHEFDLGVEGLANAAKHADFQMLAANYFTDETAIDEIVKGYMVKKYEGLRIGIFGLGIRLNDLVDPALIGKVRYRDPVIISRRIVQSLRRFHKCDYIICLSHLGYRYDEADRMDDLKLARSVPGIDLVIGGHTHTFLDEPVIINHPDE
ncbi:MAG: bifunctional metallophosphatase/5'-nucleotidase, partial [Bacteroidetes bacterium]|nr:bifunctional metallophosphatase/5'-nucleotidase [Bacteroidota bacterium]